MAEKLKMVGCEKFDALNGNFYVITIVQQLS